MNRPSSSFQIHCISITIFLGICISALSFNQSHYRGSQVSPENSGYIMNRPVDIETQQEKADTPNGTRREHQSEDLVFLESL